MMDREKKRNHMLEYLQKHNSFNNLLEIGTGNDSRGNPMLTYIYKTKNVINTSCELTLTFLDKNISVITIFIPNLCNYYDIDEILIAANYVVFKQPKYNCFVNNEGDFVIRLGYYSGERNFNPEVFMKLLIQALEDVEDKILPEFERIHYRSN